MRGPSPPPVELTARQHAALEWLIRRHSAPQQLVRRARLILLAAAGHNNTEISRQVTLDRNQVRLWRTRWRAAAPRLAALEESNPEDGALRRALEELLADAPRSGAPPTFSPEQVVQLVEVACEPPADSGRPISHWTPRELAEEVIKRGIFPTISARSVGRLLK